MNVNVVMNVHVIFSLNLNINLKKGVKSTVVSVFCNETLFPAINIVDLIIWYIPNVNHLILHGNVKRVKSIY